MMQLVPARYRAKLVVVSIAFALAILGGAALALRFQPEAWFGNAQIPIRELQDALPGPVSFEGTVTYIDGPRKRFWIQDETGAIEIAQDPSPLGLRAKQVVRVS